MDNLYLEMAEAVVPPIGPANAGGLCFVHTETGSKFTDIHDAQVTRKALVASVARKLMDIHIKSMTEYPVEAEADARADA